MTSEAFNQLTREEQTRIIWQEARLLKYQKVAQWTYVLYGLDCFFIELCYDHQLQQFTTYQAFSELDRLDFYLADIHLSIDD